MVCGVGKDGCGLCVDTVELRWNGGEGGRWRGEPVSHGLVVLEEESVSKLTVDRAGLRSMVGVEKSKSTKRCALL